MITELMIAKGHLCLHANCQGGFTKNFSIGESAPWRQKTKKETLRDILENLSNQRLNALIFSQLCSESSTHFFFVHTKHEQYKGSPVGSSGRKRSLVSPRKITWLQQTILFPGCAGGRRWQLQRFLHGNILHLMRRQIAFAWLIQPYTGEMRKGPSCPYALQVPKGAAPFCYCLFW